MNEPVRTTPRRDPPRYFHLLWDEDLEELSDVLTAVRDRRSEVVSVWYELYQLHFGDHRALSEIGFRKIFEPALLAIRNSSCARTWMATLVQS